MTEIIFTSPITEVAKDTFYDANANVPTYNLATENVTLYFVYGQKTLEFNAETNIYQATEENLKNGTDFCETTFKAVCMKK